MQSAVMKSCSPSGEKEARMEIVDKEVGKNQGQA